jgi:hypothetical protein
MQHTSRDLNDTSIFEYLKAGEAQFFLYAVPEAVFLLQLVISNNSTAD